LLSVNINRLFAFLEVTAELMAPGKLPGCSGTRNLHDNLADLRGQVAANQRVSELCSASVIFVTKMPRFTGHWS